MDLFGLGIFVTFVPIIKSNNNKKLKEMNELKRKGWVNYFFVETFVKYCLDFSGKLSCKQFWLAYVWYLFFGGDCLKTHSIKKRLRLFYIINTVSLVISKNFRNFIAV